MALQTLTTIFNVLSPTSESRYHVFLAILKVIRQVSNPQTFEALILQLETNIPAWLSAWQLDDEDARSLYIAAADVASSTGNEDLQYTYLLHALSTIPPDQASETESAELAKRTLRAALINPSIKDFTPLTNNDAIIALRKTDSALFDLLEIFSSDDYSSYTDFLETNSLSDLSIDESSSDILSTKIRLLTLSTIAASAPTRSVSYAQIASALQIPSEDVEMWVIDTIRAGLVEGKLSQMKQEFLVQRATYRVFGEKQWAEIQGRLMVWRRSLESVLSIVRSEREKFLRDGVSGGETNVNGYGFDGEWHGQGATAMVAAIDRVNDEAAGAEDAVKAVAASSVNHVSHVSNSARSRSAAGTRRPRLLDGLRLTLTSRISVGTSFGNRTGDQGMVMRVLPPPSSTSSRGNWRRSRKGFRLRIQIRIGDNAKTKERE